MIYLLDPVANLSTNDSSPRGWARRRVNPWFLASRCAAKGENGLRFIPRRCLGRLSTSSTTSFALRPAPTSTFIDPLYIYLLYAAVLCATVDARGCKGVCRVISRRTRPAFSLPWLYLTSIIKINRPISYVKYYRRAFLNILSLSTFPRLPNGCRVPSFLLPPEQKEKGDERDRT